MRLIAFFSGAVSLGYLIAGMFFLRYWRKTRDSLFFRFGLAFGFFSISQILTSMLGPVDERTGYAYGLRILGFVVILVAIVEKNRSRSTRPSRASSRS